METTFKGFEPSQLKIVMLIALIHYIFCCYKLLKILNHEITHQMHDFSHSISASTIQDLLKLSHDFFFAKTAKKKVRNLNSLSNEKKSL